MCIYINIYIYIYIYRISFNKSKINLFQNHFPLHCKENLLYSQNYERVVLQVATLGREARLHKTTTKPTTGFGSSPNHGTST
jgi:hypothetical protein